MFWRSQTNTDQPKSKFVRLIDSDNQIRCFRKDAVSVISQTKSGHVWISLNNSDHTVWFAEGTKLDDIVKLFEE